MKWVLLEVYQAEPIMEAIKSEMDEIVVRAVQKVDVNVDKDEIIKALAYDRGQYESGYVDGIRDAVVRCRECKWGRTVRECSEYVWCGKPYASPWASHKADWYCADGKRKEDVT